MQHELPTSKGLLVGIKQFWSTWSGEHGQQAVIDIRCSAAGAWVSGGGSKDNGDFLRCLAYDGTVCAGRSFQLGRGGLWTDWASRRPLLSFACLVLFNKSVLVIACGVWHSLALTGEGVVGQTGVVWAFGRGSGGELGLGDFECRFVPTVIKGTLLGERVMRISAGGWNSAALTDKGHVFVWGHNQYSQLAASALVNKPSPEPRKIETLQMMDASGVFCGPAHMAVVTKDGRLYTWGRGDRGQLVFGCRQGERATTGESRRRG